MKNVYGLAADLLVVFHLLFVCYIVFGEVFILAGAALRLKAVRNRVFRITHLAAILIVSFEAAVGAFCPLTVWESVLRDRAGQGGSSMHFIPRLVHAVLFFDFPLWVFNTAYILFGAAVVLTFLLIPPRKLSPGEGTKHGS